MSPLGTGDDATMTDDDSRLDRAVSTLNRRQALAGGASLLTAGGTLVWVGDPASAQVTVDQFAVSDASFESDSVDPVVDVTAAYAYDVGTRPVNSLRFTLAVGDSEIASEELVTDESTLENTTTLSGRIADAAAWSLSDFAVDAGDSTEHTVSVTLGFAVLESDGSEIVSDSATDEATVAVTHPQDSAVTASVGGEGLIRDGSQ